MLSSVQEAYRGFIEGLREGLEELRSHDPSYVPKGMQAMVDGKDRIFAVRVRGRLSHLAASLRPCAPGGRFLCP